MCQRDLEAYRGCRRTAPDPTNSEDGWRGVPLAHPAGVYRKRQTEHPSAGRPAGSRAGVNGYVREGAAAVSRGRRLETAWGAGHAGALPPACVPHAPPHGRVRAGWGGGRGREGAQAGAGGGVRVPGRRVVRGAGVGEQGLPGSPLLRGR